MPTMFEQMLRDLVEPNVDKLYGETFVLIPWAQPENGRGGPDPDREVMPDLIGVFDNQSHDVGVQMGVRKTYREANDLRTINMGREPVLTVDRRQFGSLAGEPRQGDRVKFPGRPDLPHYEVVTVERDGLTRVKMRLVQRGSQA